MSEKTKYDLTPIPQAATVEIGTECTRNCGGCAFKETPLTQMTPQEMEKTISTLSDYWNHIAQDPEHQLIGAKIVEFIGGAGIMNRLSSEDLRGILEVGRASNLSHIAFMCDAKLDERAIKDFFEVSAEMEATNPSGMKNIIALSLDDLPKHKDGDISRWAKSKVTWDMLDKRNDYIQNPETQNFRVFTTISTKNLDDISQIAEDALKSGALLFVAPLTIHSKAALDKTGVTGRLLMGTDTELLVTEKDRPRMEIAVTKLRELKKQYPNTFLNNEATFENMLACCKPTEEAFKANCREKCSFTTESGEKLVATPNFRVMHRPDKDEMTLGICTCMVGPTDEDDNYANTPLNMLTEIVDGTITTEDLYRKLTHDLVTAKCPGCNTRTAIDITRGEGLK